MADQRALPPLSEVRLVEDFQAELTAIGEWWLTYSQDETGGGFFGEVGVDNQPVDNAAKGIVLNTRILWFFSEAAAHFGDQRYRLAADRAYAYLVQYFEDQEYGGYFWSVDADGKPTDTKKQVYAQAFAIYALTAYCQLTGFEDARKRALKCFELVERHAVDREKCGYLEAFNRDWSTLDDVRLSDKDLNYPKTMNTHLHVLEAYTSLCAANPSSDVERALRYAIACFDRYIINREANHLRMFMDLDWNDHSPGFTYGHDIECSWLLAKAVEALGDQKIRARLHSTIITLAETCLREAIGEHGELLEGYDFANERPIIERIWWAQAEALVGFLKAYRLTDDNKYLTAAEHLWHFIKEYQIDENGGEWLWRSKLDNAIPGDGYKLGFWKGPYHNGRAMLESIKTLKRNGMR